MSFENEPSSLTPDEPQAAGRGSGFRRLFFLVSVIGVGVLASGVYQPVSSGPASGLTFDRPRDLILPEYPIRNRIKVAHFNIHSGVGTDGAYRLDRIAELIQEYDWVGLNEVRGSGYQFESTPQIETLGRQLKKPFLFAPTERQWWRDSFGNGAISPLPIQHQQRIPLPQTSNKGRGYRNLLLSRVRLPAGMVTILVTHLDRTVDRAEQLRVVHELFSSLASPVILMGDFNTPPDDPLLQLWLSEPGMIDALSVKRGLKQQRPADRIDWLLVRGLNVLDSGLVTTAASDHPLIWAELEFVPQGE